MHCLLLLAAVGVALANYGSQSSGYEPAEMVQPAPQSPPSSDGGDQQGYNTDGSQSSPVNTPTVGDVPTSVQSPPVPPVAPPVQSPPAESPVQSPPVPPAPVQVPPTAVAQPTYPAPSAPIASTDPVPPPSPVPQPTYPAPSPPVPSGGAATNDVGYRARFRAFHRL
ncbi:hypothetical protein GCK32_022121 [Trichostrongylus colubriformis]|uniref:Uncharacterized protein n=1 Tax=Trichostrongylus colubriformis TaxID=6319 RepID=A0AAN8FYV2_TRICO